ncbi:hemagglutinin [Mycoplasmopsis synoviae]|uniref:hemagglutinin n=1 Tax=Mycoplasmopsis synoviae TaxID=2109 RepID=UPI00387A8DA3
MIQPTKLKLENDLEKHQTEQGLSDQLTKKLGAERFKNVKLTFKEASFSGENNVKTPTVTFTVAAKDGYTLVDSKENASATEISLVVRVLYNRDNESTIQMPTQGASPTAVPNGANTADHPQTIKDINVYLNYTGSAIVLDQAVPAVGTAANTSLNGTSNVTDDFNNKFIKLLVKYKAQTSLFQTIINYVNKFNPKFPAEFVTNSTNGVTITKVQKDKQKRDRELRPGTLDDLLSNKNNVFLQQIKGDTEAVYFAVTAIASNGWLNTFLIRIPLTKFVKPLTEFRPTTPTSPSSDTQQEQTEQTGGNQDASGGASESGTASQPQQAAS